jgi:hypothetical protein
MFFFFPCNKNKLLMHPPPVELSLHCYFPFSFFFPLFPISFIFPSFSYSCFSSLLSKQYGHCVPSPREAKQNKMAAIRENFCSHVSAVPASADWPARLQYCWHQILIWNREDISCLNLLLKNKGAIVCKTNLGRRPSSDCMVEEGDTEDSFSSVIFLISGFAMVWNVIFYITFQSTSLLSF